MGEPALGAAIGAFPGGLFASRVDSRAAVVVGLLLVAGTSVGFGLVEGYWALVGARLAQGFGSALVWTGALSWLVSLAPQERRGEVIGIAMAAAIGGALLGPVLGAAASELGRAPAFSAVAGVCVLLAALSARMPHPGPGDRQSLSVLGRALRSPRVLAGMWLITLPALLFGTLSVLAPLQLDRLGFGVVAVAATFLASAAIEATVSPIVGRVSDRRGRLLPITFGLVASAAVSLTIPWLGSAWALAPVVVASGVAYGVFWAPVMAMLSDGWERAGVGHGLGFALMNFAWAPGHVVGSAAGGGLADLGGDVTAYSVLAALCVGTLAALHRGRRRARLRAPARAS